MDCSTPGFPVHHQLPELAQTHVHRVDDAIQSSHLLSSPSSPAFNISQHQGLFQWVSSLHQVAKVLELQLQPQSLQWIFSIQGWFPLGLTGLISLLSKELSRVFSSTTVWKHQFFSIQPSYRATLTSVHDYWKNQALTIWTFVGRVKPLLFNMLFRFVIAFLPRSKDVLISCISYK